MFYVVLLVVFMFTSTKSLDGKQTTSVVLYDLFLHLLLFHVAIPLLARVYMFWYSVQDL